MFSVMSLQEYVESQQWRIKPLDANVDDMFRADMVLVGVSSAGEGSLYARGYIFNDSRDLFDDGEVVCTSTIKEIREVEGVRYIETRNTLYRVIGEISK